MKWLEISRDFRTQEAQNLEQELEEIEEDINDLEEGIKSVRKYRDKNLYDYSQEAVSEREMSFIRTLNYLKDKRWDIIRRLRDLIRWDRDDLNWLGTLKGRETRERTNRQKSIENPREEGRYTEGRTPAPTKENRYQETPREEKRYTEKRTPTLTRKNRQHKKHQAKPRTTEG
jgi:hypothetical protein